MLLPGQIDDGGFMEAGYRGLLRIEHELQASVSYIDRVQPQLELLTDALRKLAAEEPDLIIAPSTKPVQTGQSCICLYKPRSIR